MNSLDGRVVPTINGFKQFDNGGKGSGNFGHSGRPGKVGGSGNGEGLSGEDSRSSKIAEPKLDEGSIGQSSLIIEEDDGKYEAKSYSDQWSTSGVLAVEDALSKIAGLPYRKSLKGEKITDKQKEVFETLSGVRRMLQDKTSELGDSMTFADKKIDLEDFKSLYQKVREPLQTARKQLEGDDSKVGKALSQTATELGNISGVLQMAAEESVETKSDKPRWHDVTRLFKK